MPAIALAVSYGATRSVKNSGGQLINFYAEEAPKDAKSPVTLFGVPGLVTHHDVTAATMTLAAVVVNDSMYVVTNEGLYKVYANGSAKRMGNVTLQRPATMSSNGLTMMATDGVKAYLYTITTDEDVILAPVVTEYTDPDFTPAWTVTHLNGRFIFDKKGTNQFVNTQVLSTEMTALAFAAAESNADRVLAVLADHGDLFVFGTRSMEVFYDAALSPGSPYLRQEGRQVEYGLSSPYAVAAIENTVAWCSPTKMIYRTVGAQVAPIGTPAVIDALKDYDWATAEAMTYMHRAHPFFVFSMQDGSDNWISFAFDLSTGLWHKLVDTAQGRYRLAWSVHVYGKQFGGHFADGKIYEITEDAFAFDEAAIVSEVITPPAHYDQQIIDFSTFEIEPDVGVGYGVGGASEPQVQMRYSNDALQTFSGWLSRSLGSAGQFNRRIRWNRLGSARDRRFHFKISDPVPRAILSRGFVGGKN